MTHPLPLSWSIDPRGVHEIGEEVLLLDPIYEVDVADCPNRKPENGW